MKRLLPLFAGLALAALPAAAATTSDPSLASQGLVDLTTSTSGTASTSTSFLSGYGADKLFDDGSLTDASRYISTGCNTAPSVVTWTFHAATPVNAYMLLNTAYDQVNRAPKEWFLDGSTNGTDWVRLDTRDNETSWGANEKRYFSFANSTAYTQYRWTVLPNSGDRVSLYEMELYYIPSRQPLTVTAAPGELGTSGPAFGT